MERSRSVVVAALLAIAFAATTGVAAQAPADQAQAQPPAHRQQPLYDRYRSAFAQNLSLATGPLAIGLSKGTAAPAVAAR